MNQQTNKGGHRWAKGVSGNPAGRPLGSRQRIAEALLRDLGEVWAEQGKTILERLALSDPGKLATIAFGLLPREAFLSVQTQSMVGGAEWQGLRAIIDAIRAAGVDGDDPEQVFGYVLECVNRGNPKLIEGTVRAQKATKNKQ